MTAKKLSTKAEFMLGIVREHTVWNDGKLERYYVPQSSRHKIYSVFGEDQGPLGYVVGRSGDAGALRMLEARGLIRSMPASDYAYAVTEDGMVEYECIAACRRAERGETR